MTEALEPEFYRASTAGIDTARISRNAIEVLRKLRDAGFQAFLVGGCVRDLLLQQTPKDFDVATDAHPEEVHDLFRRSRIIGRRFRLVHVRYGRDEVIEVATFRSSHAEADDLDPHSSSHSNTGMILRDNVYGTVAEDAARRDFSMNALYLDVDADEIRDYVAGLSDLQHHRIDTIGPAAISFREDPVRMLRAARFACKLGLEFSADITAQIPLHRELLAQIPPARLFDEFNKLFLAGNASAMFDVLEQHALFGELFPDTGDFLDVPFYRTFVRNALANTDARIAEGKRVTPAFLIAALLWPQTETRMKALVEKASPMLAMQRAAQFALDNQAARLAIPRRFSTMAREIWEMQLRLPRRYGRRAEQLLEHKRFRAAYDFVLLREQSGEDLDGLGQWWTSYQDADDKTRREMAQAGSNPRQRKRRPRRRKAPQQAASQDGNPSGT